MLKVLVASLFVCALGSALSWHDAQAQESTTRPAAFSLNFTATDAAGKPLAGALVIVAYSSEDDDPEARHGWQQEVDYTGNDGKLEVSSDKIMDDDWAGPLTLRFSAFKQGLAAPAVQKLRVEPGSKQNISLAFSTGGTIRGKVVDAAGQPVADATVIASTEAEPALKPRLDHKLEDPAQYAATDAEGNFALAGVTAGEWYVVTKLPGHDPAASALVKVEADKTVTLSAEIKTARVTALKFKLSVARRMSVTAVFYGADDETFDRKIKSDETGLCWVTDVPAGAVRFEVVCKGFKRSASHAFKLVSGQHTHAGTITLEAE